MSSKVNNFVVETEGHCFLCHDRVTKVKWEAQTQPQTFSLQYLSRYLKLDMGKVFHEEGPIPPHLLAMVEGARLKAELCGECTHFAGAFSKLYRNWEKIKLEMAFMISILQGKLANATKHRDGKAELSGKRKIVEVLRTETIQKCSKKLKSAPHTLQVKVQNMTRKQIGKKMLKMKISSQHLSRPIGADPEMMAVGEVKLEAIAFHSSEDNQDNHDDRNYNLDYLDENDDDFDASTTANEQITSVASTSTIDITNSGTPMEASYQKHCRLNTETNKIECDVCCKAFSDQSGFRLHYNSAHLKIKFRCNLCGTEFKFRTDYTRHHKIVHLGIKIKCELCSETFKRKDVLLIHYRKKHPGAQLPLGRKKLRKDKDQ